jgi:hypothetical protein
VTLALAEEEVMKNAKRIPLTTEDAQPLTRDRDWKLFEIPRQDWDLIPGLQRREDTFACMGSASPNDFRLLNMIQRCVAGFDQLVHETNPKPGEPPGNAYHYVVQESGRQDYPYILHGPFCTETRIPHHFEPADLNAYDEDDEHSG